MPLGGKAAGGEWGLTRRERQVLLLLVDGATSAQIAHAMGIKEDTVNQHLNAARGKLGAQNRIELAALALRKEVVQLQEHTRVLVWEVSWTEPDEVGEAFLRYQPREAVRRYPEFRDWLDRSYSEFLPDWRNQFAPVIEAIEKSRHSDYPVGFKGEVEMPQPAGRVSFEGSVEPLSESHFLLLLDSPLPT